MEFTSFIQEANLIVIAVIYALGLFIKASELKDKYIPFILLAVGVTLCLVIGGLNADAFMQGVLCSATAVFANQLIKQASK